MNILIVEDNESLNETIKNALLNEGFNIFSALDGSSAKRISFKERPDIVLLDIMLPDVKGYNLINFFKKNGNPVIIMISALEEEESRRIAYEKGADDYIIKPITLFELKYKLKAIKKRSKKEQFIFEVGDIKFDIQHLELTCQNNTVLLQHSQIEVLKRLYDKYLNDEILDKNELIDFEGMGKSVNFRIHTLIGRLRKKLSEVGSEKIIIDNEYGKGYRMIVMK
ncbi:response regulator transcription factor [Maledivibacter halophilus]|uniref:Stage 0 sporulation protein A homolog n=1 Tax=Maledivibacter halophilus TaxID=36842 RepID=A0A1T5ICK1_9FIRM|nr:response regulator transcription factor [Maledivibacter halophilus]SKC36800.1 Transcriptional regulatory protein, C terminal [Maledivibacter halophilus]